MSLGDAITLSLSGRFLVNVEALNMVESVGNVTRHRRAPIAMHSDGKYAVVYVPVASGESIAYHYQKLLANIAKSMDLNVTDLDIQGYYLKFSDNEIIKSWYKEVADVINVEDPCSIERRLVKASVVADVGGFLYTNKSVKRTSRVRFSYLVPSLDAVTSGVAVSYPQFHVRYAPPQASEKQALYYVESSSALYTLSSVLVASDIARLEYCSGESELVNEKIKRVDAALRALVALIDGLSFGAKRSRYLPIWDVRSLIVSVSKGPIEFTVSPASDKSYIKKTLSRVKVVKEKLGLTIKTFIYDGEGVEIPKIQGVEVETCETHTEALAKASSYVIGLLSGKEPKVSP
ncbi:MAG: type I-A CRISPR-associated protein Cas7/Csa2 [Acidilobaceae archaeon]